MGNSTADVVAGAQAGKNALENNFLLQMLVPPPPVAQTPNNTGNTEGAPDLPTNYESSNKITQGQHAEIRNSEGRPVGAVINDVQKSRPADILLQEDGRWIVKGSGGNIHVIDPNGEVVTSFKNSDKNTAQRLNDGRWSRPDSGQLEEFKNKFSDYVRW